MSFKNRIDIIIGDITEESVDAIVNAANNDLWLGGGVAGAIRIKGGPSIQDECNKIGAVDIGEAALTKGGNLPAKYIIHAAVMGIGSAPTERSISETTKASLKIAYENSFVTVSFPALGTGIGGFPIEKAAKIMLGLTVDYLKKHSVPRTVRFVLFSENHYTVFNKVLEAIN
ncbi:macro domain-containing protein [bacterium]|nr:macro domain-containing protein [bacterium]